MSLAYKQYGIPLAVYTVCSFSIILFAQPLFTAFDYDFAAIISLIISLVLFFRASERAASMIGVHPRTIITALLPESLIALVIPASAAFTNALINSQIDITGGASMYFSITIPVVVNSLLFGIHFGSSARPPLRRRIATALFWIGTLILSLLPGYFSEQLYSYGWQYGYFPGFVWDEYVHLGFNYWVNQLVFIAAGSLFLYNDLQPEDRSHRGLKALFKARVRTIETRPYQIILYALFAGLWVNSEFVLERETIEKLLPSVISTERTTINTDTSTTDDERRYLQHLLRRDKEIVSNLYKTDFDARIYLYPTDELLGRYVGTRSASIAKPWRGTISMSRENIGSLRHELVHIALARFGSFPFDINWSTGLTEGAAVAVEDNYDGIRDCNEYAARILQLGLARGIRQIMSFSGFASETSGKSYTLAGSFCTYLIRKYGSGTFLKLYQSGDYRQVYGKTIDELEHEWIASLRPLQLSMTRYDSLRTRFYFDRPSIVNQINLRGIGRLLRTADRHFDLHQYQEADSVYRVITNISSRLDAIRARVLCHLRMNDAAGALNILDAYRSSQQEHLSAALHILRGDCMFLATGDTTRAMKEWKSAMDLELSDKQVTSAYIRYFYLSQIEPKQALQLLQRIYSGEPITEEQLPPLENKEVLDADHQTARCALHFIIHLSERRFAKAQKAALLGLMYSNTGFSNSRSRQIVAQWMSTFVDETNDLYPANTDPPAK